MTTFLSVCAGGALGAGARHLVNVALLRLLGAGFPWATLTVNVVGSLVMGMLAHIFLTRLGLSAELRAFLMTGILGGFTTFSAFSLEAAALWERGDSALAIGYVAASVVLSIGALVTGLAVARAIFPAVT